MRKKKKETMNDFANIGEQESRPEELIDASEVSWNDLDVADFKAYNEEINDHLDMYTRITPKQGSILLRLYAKDIPVEDGVIRPNKTKVKIPTHSNIGVYQTIEDPFNFSKKAVVVATPEDCGYDVGDVVILEEALQLVPLGSGGDVAVTLPGGFIHPDSNLVDMPTNPKSPHFGYTIKREFDILCKDGRVDE